MRPLVLPTSVTRARAGRAAHTAASWRSSEATGVARRQKSASFTPAARSVVALVHHARAERRLQARGAPAHRHDLPRQPALAGGARHRAAQETETDDAEPGDHARLASCRTFRSAFIRRRFSSGVPMVTRSVLSIPNESMGRTMTPSRRSRW